MALERTAQADNGRWWLARTCVLALCLAMGGVVRAEAQTPRILPESVPDFSADTSRVKIESVASGDWSSPSTWQGAQIPTANNVVLIRPEHTVTIGSQAAVAYTVAIDGTLRFAPNANTRLTVTNLQVMAGFDGMGTPGVLEVGTVGEGGGIATTEVWALDADGELVQAAPLSRRHVRRLQIAGHDAAELSPRSR